MKEGYIAVTGGNVYYKIVGDGSKTPIILLHGGPGGTHVPFMHLENLGNDRQVIFYDQLGSGKSDRPTDHSLWNIDRFVEELGQIREALGLSKLHILGHSWGTMLAASYLLNQPEGVQSIIFSSPCLSVPQWEKDQEMHLKQLPEEVQEILSRCEREGTTDTEEYKTAMKEFNKRFVYRLDSKPKEMESPYAKSNSIVYNTMWGPSEFCTTGNLKEYDVTERLKEIQLPAMFTCGRYDEATPQTVEGYSHCLPGSIFHVYEQSAHLPYLEEPAEYIGRVRSFLDHVEKQ